MEGCGAAVSVVPPCCPEILLPTTILEVASASPLASSGAMWSPSGGLSAGGSSTSAMSIMGGWVSSSSAGASTRGRISTMGAGSRGAPATSPSPGSTPAGSSCCPMICEKMGTLVMQLLPSTYKELSLHPQIRFRELTPSNLLITTLQGLVAIWARLVIPRGGASGCRTGLGLDSCKGRKYLCRRVLGIMGTKSNNYKQNGCLPSTWEDHAGPSSSCRPSHWYSQ